MKQKTESKTPDNKMLVSNQVLSEIRAEICPSLQEAISLTMEGTVVQGDQVAILIQPIVRRLQSICEENNFPE